MLTLADGERTGRLVHDDDLRPRAQRGGDLDQLLLRRGQFADGHVHVEVGLDLIEHGAGLVAHTAAVEPAGARGQIAEAKILRDGEVGAEGEFLMHHRDAESARG